MSIWLRKNGTPVLISVALAVLPFLYFSLTGVSWSPLDPFEHLVQNLLAYFFLLFFSFFNHTVFVPKWYLNKRYWKYGCVTVICILGVAYLPYRIEQWLFFKKPVENTVSAWTKQIFVEEMMLNPPGPKHHRDHDKPPRFERFEHGPGDRSISVILPAKLAIFFLIGSVSSLISILIQATNRLRRVENDQLQAELRQLKAQIQPHFLFNTLNSIYALAIRNDPRTADTIVKLSEFLRYIIRDAHRDKVPLSAEVHYMDNYIALQKARLRDAVQVKYVLEGEPNGFLIAPLILFSFVENAFKYGVNPEEESPISIHLNISGNDLKLIVANNKVRVSQLEASTGIGLRNTQERLRLAYPGAHKLQIDDTETQFRVTLSLQLT